MTQTDCGFQPFPLVALRAVGIGPGDAVFVPDYAYPATAAVVAIVGATPFLVGVEPENGLIDLDAAARSVNSRTKTIMPVSEFGNPLNHDRLSESKRKRGLWVIEDAACALGSEFRGRRTGSLTDITVFSLHPRKFITTGEGGLITTDYSSVCDWIHSYKHFEIEGSDTGGLPVFARIGTNYKLSDVQSAFGLAQMEHAENLLAGRRELADRYHKMLQSDRRVVRPSIAVGGVSSWQSYCVLVPHRDAILKQLREDGTEVQIGALGELALPFIGGGDCTGRRRACGVGIDRAEPPLEDVCTLDVACISCRCLWCCRFEG